MGSGKSDGRLRTGEGDWKPRILDDVICDRSLTFLPTNAVYQDEDHNEHSSQYQVYVVSQYALYHFVFLFGSQLYHLLWSYRHFHRVHLHNTEINFHNIVWKKHSRRQFNILSENWGLITDTFNEHPTWDRLRIKVKINPPPAFLPANPKHHNQNISVIALSFDFPNYQSIDNILLRLL